jgi:hypothetical protein
VIQIFKAGGDMPPASFFRPVVKGNKTVIEYSGPWHHRYPAMYVQLTPTNAVNQYKINTYIVFSIKFSRKVAHKLILGEFDRKSLTAFEDRLKGLRRLGDVTLTTGINIQPVDDTLYLRVIASAQNQLPNEILYEFKKTVYGLYKEFRTCLFNNTCMLNPYELGKNSREY